MEEDKTTNLKYKTIWSPEREFTVVGMRGADSHIQKTKIKI